jgi:thiamine phosphate synthase YjbQ (UPF0047 family)
MNEYFKIINHVLVFNIYVPQEVIYFKKHKRTNERKYDSHLKHARLYRSVPVPILHQNFLVIFYYKEQEGM